MAIHILFPLKPKYYKTLVLSGGAMRGVYLLGALNGLKIKLNKYQRL